jgi:hypothetical protein
MNGSTEGKIFAPGYGEYFTRDGHDVEALALAVPTDAATTPIPNEIAAMGSGAQKIIDAAAAGRWSTASASLAVMPHAWAALPSSEVPRLLGTWMDRAMGTLTAAVTARDEAAARQAAIHADQSVLDLELRYRPPSAINLARMDLWAKQVQADAAAKTGRRSTVTSSRSSTSGIGSGRSSIPRRGPR